MLTSGLLCFRAIICKIYLRHCIEGEKVMNEDEVFNKLNAITTSPQFALTFGDESEQAVKIAEHKAWLQSIRHERPSPMKPYKVGIYIRYFNQTKYENYLAYHKKQFEDTVALCPKWQLVDFYVDEGQSAPNMESAPGWSKLLIDAMDGKVDLIITQKVSNISKKIYEAILCSRLLASQTPPIGIYFISEDIFTTASYYKDDLKDTFFLPSPEWEPLPDDEKEAIHLLESRRMLND